MVVGALVASMSKRAGRRPKGTLEEVNVRCYEAQGA